MLDVKLNRTDAAAPKDAATLILVREGASGVEIFCVQRSKESRFMGGAIVFPGGKLDARDADAAWNDLATAPRSASFANDEAHLRALAIAACRESLEEAAILPVSRGTVSDDDLLALRTRAKDDADAIRSFLAERSLVLDLAALHALGRWITPEAESRRFDARFFVCVAPAGQSGAHDQYETTHSFWATAAEILRRFEAGEVQLAPPTHRIVTLLGEQPNAAAVLAMADRSCKEPICPKLVQQGDTMALVLPGDPEHEVRESRVAGGSRYVLRDGRWRSEDPTR
jgi:8-oxo-dGTP pyrophosphatase MutT (NUDIX family)